MGPNSFRLETDQISIGERDGEALLGIRVADARRPLAASAHLVDFLLNAFVPVRMAADKP